jgi:hypothetical protein
MHFGLVKIRITGNGREEPFASIEFIEDERARVYIITALFDEWPSTLAQHIAEYPPSEELDEPRRAQSGPYVA